MRALNFLVVNSFAEKLFGGNPAAVVPNTQGLGKETMQAIARQMNLVETVFVFPSTVEGADFHFRYFTLEEELPVAGHPTVAACIALAKTNAINTHVKQEYRIQTGKGTIIAIISGSSDEPFVRMEQPPPVFGGIVGDRGAVADVLGLKEEDLPPALPIVPVDTGLGHLIVPVKALPALMGIRRNINPLKALCAEYGVREVQAFAFEAYDPANQLHTRNICPREGLEDPACGVGNGALGAYLLKYYYETNQEIRFRAEQGNIVDMPSVIEVHASRTEQGVSVSVGGTGKVMIEGTFHISG